MQLIDPPTPFAPTEELRAFLAQNKHKTAPEWKAALTSVRLALRDRLREEKAKGK